MRLQQQVPLAMHADRGAGRLRNQELGRAHQLVGQHVDDPHPRPALELELGPRPQTAQGRRRRAEHALSVRERRDDDCTSAP